MVCTRPRAPPRKNVSRFVSREAHACVDGCEGRLANAGARAGASRALHVPFCRRNPRPVAPANRRHVGRLLRRQLARRARRRRRRGVGGGACRGGGARAARRVAVSPRRRRRRGRKRSKRSAWADATSASSSEGGATDLRPRRTAGALLISPARAVRARRMSGWRASKRKTRPPASLRTSARPRPTHRTQRTRPRPVCCVTGLTSCALRRLAWSAALAELWRSSR